MNKEKISSQEIIDLVASKLSISKRVAEDFLKSMFATIEESLLEGNSVKIKNFGTFKLQWNEPRKSVNVNTGKEIVLEGFNKIVFTPDDILKNIVNEPFAHLEPVILDELEEKQHFTDPLKIFNDQAIEIKNILSEINSTSKNIEDINEISSNDEDFTENVEEANDLHTPEMAEINEEPEIFFIENSVKEPETNIPETENVSEIIEQPVEVPDIEKSDEISSTTLIQESKIEEQAINKENRVVEIIKSKVEPEDITVENIKNKRKKLGILIIFLFLIGGGILMYFYNLNFHSWINRNVLSKSVKTINWSGKNVTPALHITPGIADSILQDSANALRAVDPYEVLFEKTRKYEDLITIDRTVTINSLTSLSQKFYGHKEFWVYIFEANITNIPDPENIKTGTLIRIPKIDERLIDVENPRSFEMAQKLNYILLKRTAQTSDTLKVKTENISTTIASETKNELKPVSNSYIETVKFVMGDRLTYMAKKYYGHKDFWIYIFEANKDVIKNPDVVPVGTVINIPKMDPALVDPRNPECIKKARLRYENYLQKSR